MRIYGGPPDLSRGDEVEFVAQLGMVRLFRNAGLSDPWPGAARRGHLLSGSALMVEKRHASNRWAGTIDRARARVRSRIFNTYSETAIPLARALVLGENDLDRDDAEAFRQSGLLHLLAVSGTHLVIAVLALVGALNVLLVRMERFARRFDVQRLSSGLGAILSLLYADFSGGSGSAWRAAFMLCVVCGGRALGFPIRGSAALGASLLIGLALDPLMASDYSFLLSALATSGLIGLGQPLSERMTRGLFRHPPLKQLVASLIATVSSTLPCAPVLALMDGDMTAAALFANVIAAPLGEIIALPACLLHAVVAPFPALENGLALVGSGALEVVRAIALWSASVHEAQFSVPFPSPWNTALLLCTLLLLRGPFRWGWLITATAAVMATLVGSTVTEQAEENALSVTALDVGQGDALLLDFPDGRVGLMDGGGFVTGLPDTGTRVILPMLRARNVNHLDLVAVSHAHPDHILGLLSVAQEIPIRELWIPHPPKKPGGYLARLVHLATKSGAVVHDAEALCGSREWGGLQVQVLAPCGRESTSLGANDRSLVLRLQHGERSALLTGDIEGPAENLLLATARRNLRSDLLKVAHHGSNTSSQPTFVDAVDPQLALISSGVRNRFDHPRPATLKTLTERSIAVLRTDRLGSLTWKTDGSTVSVHSFSSAPPGLHTGSFFAEAHLHPRTALSLPTSQPSLSHGL